MMESDTGQARTSTAVAAGPADEQALERARRRRSDLHGVLVELESALAAPASGRVTAWSLRVHEALVELGAAFERHIAVTEGPDGLFESVTSHAPRLAGTIDEFTRQHRQIRQSVGDALDAVHRAADAAEPFSTSREAVLDLIEQLMRHRQRGADLVYEAYAVAIGGGD
ncbi:MAG: hemerythrin domain-containing protein [Egibacteraceae bacterium]